VWALRVTVAGAVCAVLALTAGAAAADPFFPDAGNRGYDVGAYHLRLRYDPATGVLHGNAAIVATATQRLTSFHLDFRMRPDRVGVDGRRASFRRRGQELIVTPAVPVEAGAAFRVRVIYAGAAHPVTDPDGSPDGFIPTDDGAFVAGEPQGAPSWFPANDTPLDKARFSVTMTVPAGLTAVGNGRLVSSRTAHGWSTFHWSEALPMATYLATITIGRFDVATGTADGIPSYVAVDPREAAAAAPALARLPAILAFEQHLLGPYPFGQVGAIVDHHAGAGYALETQTRPVFDGAPDASTLAHELAHQWFGDSVSLRHWPDIWLNEGFATYIEWLWDAQDGGPSVAGDFRRVLDIPASSSFWCVAPNALPGPEWLFSGQVYVRGAATLEALRRRIGDDAFFRLLPAWARIHAYGNGTTAQFEQLAERTSGRRLGRLFAAWLRTPGKPGSAIDPCARTAGAAAAVGWHR
jgi:aminopeptidase N